MKFIVIPLAFLTLAASAQPCDQPKRVDQAALAMQTKMDMLSLATAIEAYVIVDNGRFPDAATVEELPKFIHPMYIAKVPLSDAWSVPYRYVVAKDGKDFRVVSAGSDRKFDEAKLGNGSSELRLARRRRLQRFQGFYRRWSTP